MLINIVTGFSLPLEVIAIGSAIFAFYLWMQFSAWSFLILSLQYLKTHDYRQKEIRGFREFAKLLI